MSCKEPWGQIADRAAGQALVPRAGVPGAATCIQVGCDAFINQATGQCVQGHSQSAEERDSVPYPAEVHALHCAITEWQRKNVGAVPSLSMYMSDLESVEEGRGSDLAYGSGFGLKEERDFYDTGSYLVREAVDFLEGQEGGWVDDPRVQAGRAFVEASRVASTRLPEVMEGEGRKEQTAALRHLVREATAVDIPDLVDALVARRKSGSLIRALLERFPEPTMDYLLSAASQTHAIDSTKVDLDSLREIIPHLTEEAKGYVVGRARVRQWKVFVAVVAEVAPQMEDIGPLLEQVERYGQGRGGARRVLLVTSKGRAGALAALAPHLDECQAGRAVSILEGVAVDDQGVRRDMRAFLNAVAEKLPRNLVYRAFAQADRASADYWERNEALVTLRKLVDRGDVSGELLFTVQQAGHTNEFLRTEILEALLNHLEGTTQWRRALGLMDSASLAHALQRMPPEVMDVALDRADTFSVEQRAGAYKEAADYCRTEHWERYVEGLSALVAEEQVGATQGMAAVMDTVKAATFRTPPGCLGLTLDFVEKHVPVEQRTDVLAEVFGGMDQQSIPRILDQVLQHGGDSIKVRKILRNMGPGMSDEQIVRAVRAATTARRQYIADGGEDGPYLESSPCPGVVLPHAVAHVFAARVPPEAMLETIELVSGYQGLDRITVLEGIVPRVPAEMIPAVEAEVQKLRRPNMRVLVGGKEVASDEEFRQPLLDRLNDRRKELA